jgi:hypothetical protein
VFGHLRMPPLRGATGWVNSEPLVPGDLAGRVVLVNFWTLTCINWLRQEPWVRAWSQAYQHDGLVVIGAHTPEFSFEHGIDGVRQATRARGIDYPVAVDDDYEIWSAFTNHYWPALYFVDREGIIRDSHFGEGRYEESDQLLRRLLGVDRPPLFVEGEGVEAPADWASLRTPETYLGYARGERLASPGGAAADRRHAYDVPGHLRDNQWALHGEWTVGSESVVVDAAGGSIAFRFHARDAHVVLAPTGDEPVPFRVLLDGEPPGASAGEDVDPEGNGVLREGRLYQLLRAHDVVRTRTLEITFQAPGAAAYSFTFG